MALALLALLATHAHTVTAAATKPHILLLVADDYGWGNAGWHTNASNTEVQTPRLDDLVRQGIELNRAYQYKFCSPTRCSLQSGPVNLKIHMLHRSPSHYMFGLRALYT